MKRLGKTAPRASSKKEALRSLLGRVPLITFVSCCDCNFLYLSQMSVPSCPKVATTNKMRLSRKNQSDHFSSQGLALGHKSSHSPQQNRWAGGL